MNFCALILSCVMTVGASVAVQSAPGDADDVPPGPVAGSDGASGAEDVSRNWLERLGFSASGSSGARRGLLLLRQARLARDAGDLEGAKDLMEQARVEWPGSPYVAHDLGDVHLRAGDAAAARHEYTRGGREGFEFRSLFQSAAANIVAAEAVLSQASVPADEGALPDGPLPPGMGPAIQEALPLLVQARRDFCRALALADDEAARESVLALTRRIDELRRMLARDESDEESEPQEDGEPNEDENSQQGEEDPSESEEQQDGEGENEGESQAGEEQEPQPADPAEQEGESAPPEDGEPMEFEAENLTDQQLADLLEQLEDIEKKALEVQRALRRSAHQAVEKDW